MKVTLLYRKTVHFIGIREVEADTKQDALSGASVAVSQGLTKTTDIDWETEGEYEDFSLMVIGIAKDE